MSFAGDDEAVRPRNDAAARYEGEDTSLTTKRELHGWFAYTIAAEVFAVVGVGEPLSHIHAQISPIALPNNTMLMP